MPPEVRRSTEPPTAPPRASGAFDPPEKCPSCGASLEAQIVKGNTCPHCGYDLESEPPHSGYKDREQRRSAGLPY